VIAVIADDLTGALDTGVQFTQAGLSVRVLLDPDAVFAESARGTEILVVDTETRSLSREIAAEIVGGCAERLGGLGANCFYKKIDSTLRGPWAEELGALQAAVGAESVVVCPAFPSQGRRVIGGVVRVDPGDRPVGSVVEALAKIGLAAVHWDGGAGTGQYQVADAESDVDLDRIAAWADRKTTRPLLCGSAGLAAAWARSLGRGRLIATHLRLPQPRRNLLVVAGSASPVTREQVRRLRTRPQGSQTVEVLAALDGEGEKDPAAAAALAEQARAFVSASPIDALVVTGGETAIRVLRALETRGVRLLGEVLPGIPASVVEGGMAQGRVLVTKAGGFGGPNTLVRVVEWLGSAGE
jgi:uncharacterized protein YgbK (DUF1537 family)